MSKKNKYKSKQKEKLISKINNHLTLVLTGITAIIAIITFLYNIYDKHTDTRFIDYYFAVKNTTKNNLIYQNTNEYYQKLINYPTFNSEINKLIEDQKFLNKNYYIIYYILEEVGNYESKKIELVLKDEINNKNYNLTINQPISKNDGLKIPIALCEMNFNVPSDYVTKKFSFKDCEKPYLIPYTLSFENKYSFSKKNINIREFNKYNFIIEGEAVAAIGGESGKKNTPWYLK